MGPEEDFYYTGEISDKAAEMIEDRVELKNLFADRKGRGEEINKECGGCRKGQEVLKQEDAQLFLKLIAAIVFLLA